VEAQLRAPQRARQFTDAQVAAARADCEAQVRPGSYAVGIVNYRSYSDLKRCLESLSLQTLQPECVVVLDVESNELMFAELEDRFPEVTFRAVPNRGFAGGANLALELITELAPAAEFALILNPDVELEPGFAGALVTEAGRHPRVALATGKLVRPDSGLIDSAGIVMPRNRRPRDRGSEERDCGQYDRTEYVFGASGAAMLLRRSCLDGLAIDGEVFDEDFFLYHEDTDLSWRANLLGYRVLYVPKARAFHERGWRANRRFEIEPAVRRHSFKNHYLQIIKNEPISSFMVNLPVLLVWEILRLGFLLLRDRELWSAYGSSWRLGGQAWRKRRILRARLAEQARSRGLA